MLQPTVDSLAQLIDVAVQLGTRSTRELTKPERALVKDSAQVSAAVVDEFRSAISLGEDPLGQNFTRLKSAAERRPMGATYTPNALVMAMTDWVTLQQPSRVIDPGAGSGRFIVAAGRALPKAHLIAVEADPEAALMLRANLRIAGLDRRSHVIVGDYCDVKLPPFSGKTAFLGNPPYVRHHDIATDRKSWLADAACKLELPASKLSGLHLYFYVMTARISAPGDVGAFVTAAEWLDVNYGELLRRLLLEQLGLISLDVIEPTAKPFDDADTTAVVSCFQVGQRHKKIAVRRVATLGKLTRLGQGKAIRRDCFESNRRWSSLSRSRSAKPEGYVELGEFCGVHRGQVTGNNRLWIAGSHSVGVPSEFLIPVITRARELFAAGAELDDARALRKLIDIPAELDRIPRRHLSAIEAFLERARALGGTEGYIATHRRAWWSVGLHEPAPILASYMARQPPAFVRNTAKARHINVAHGIYPREKLSEKALHALVGYLRRSVNLREGRMYAGGLVKFEPKEMERLIVPGPSLLEAAEPALG